MGNTERGVTLLSVSNQKPKPMKTFSIIYAILMFVVSIAAAGIYLSADTAVFRDPVLDVMVISLAIFGIVSSGLVYKLEVLEA